MPMGWRQNRHNARQSGFGIRLRLMSSFFVVVSMPSLHFFFRIYKTHEPVGVKTFGLRQGMPQNVFKLLILSPEFDFAIFLALGMIRTYRECSIGDL